ncbi:PREDICTED: uncharacterized protein LOC109221785, partial [Nicotiana attenuata]|uniref:uncharacterized protein LOC109221785 n=1 Tax=Nicotiana attenuata TaxID=49451 RepID=UPI0009051080
MALGKLPDNAVYVDDILLVGNDLSEMLSLKSYSDTTFKIKDLGLVHYFLGLEISLIPQGYIMSQHKFTSNLLSEFKCQHFSSVLTPLDPSVKLTMDMGEPISDPSLYRRLVGKLNFLQNTRPDISFSVQHLSQFLQKPQVPHMMAVLHVLRYLMKDPAQGVLLSSCPDFSLLAYSDSDWASCVISRKSVSGYFITLGGSPISWKSKKQPTISLSSAEAEYRALRKAAAEVSWLVRLLGDLGLHITSPVSMFCDSQAALHMAKNPVFHERTKHIEIDCHYVRECLTSGLLSLHYVSSSDQLADIMTKALTGQPHHELLSKLGVISPSSLRG